MAYDGKQNRQSVPYFAGLTPWKYFPPLNNLSQSTLKGLLFAQIVLPVLGKRRAWSTSAGDYSESGNSWVSVSATINRPCAVHAQCISLLLFTKRTKPPPSEYTLYGALAVIERRLVAAETTNGASGGYVL
jgi:hypothetical protein